MIDLIDLIPPSVTYISTSYHAYSVLGLNDCGLMRCMALMPMRLTETKLAQSNNRKYVIIAVIIIMIV